MGVPSGGDAPSRGGGAGEAEGHRPSKTPWRGVRRGVLAALVLLALVTIWQAWRVGSSLAEARQDLRSVVTLLEDGDHKAAVATASDAEELTARADWHSHTPVWVAAQHLPLV